MQRLRYLSLFLLLLCGLAPQSRAGILHGVVRDAKGEPLPFATVFVAGSTNGTAANASGIYQLPLPAGTYDVTCQYIGYQQSVFRLTISEAESLKHDFRLSEQRLEMSEVIVRASDEDPAYRIIRQAIAKREFHLRQVEEFQTSIYLKGVLRSRGAPDKIFGQKVEKDELGIDTSGKSVLYLCEQVADYYSQRPDKRRTVIHSVRESGNPRGLGFASFPPVVSFYANNVISIQNSRGMISPIADNALSYYKYRLEGEFREGAHLIYKIRVIPKRAFEPVSFGHIYIVDGDWAIHSLSLTSSKRYGQDMLDTLRIDQLFLPLRKDIWVIKNQQFYLTMNIFGFNLVGNFVTVYDNQKVNEPVPDSIFGGNIISTYDPTAIKVDSGYWETTRPLALEADEVRDYRQKDSMRIVREDPRRIDSLRRRDNRVKPMELLLTGVTFDDSGYRSSLRISPLVSSVNFNSVEGLNLETGITATRNLDSFSTLTLNSAFRYGFSNTHFNGIGALTYERRDPAWRSRGWSLTAEGGQYVFQYDRQHPVTPLFNTFTTLLFQYNALKIYERLTGALYFRRNGGNGFRWWARAAWERRMPLENTTTFSLRDGDSSDFTDNLPAPLRAWTYERHEAVVARLGMSWQPGYKYVMYPDYKQPIAGRKPVFTLQYEKGIHGILGSDVDWDKWQVSVAGNLPLRLFGSIDYRFSGAGFLNNRVVGLPDLIHPFAGDDPEITLASPYLRAFQMAPFYKFSNDARFYGEGHVEYNLHGLLTNKIPGLRQAKWYLILGANAFYAHEDLYFAEGFVGIDNIGFKLFRFFRLDFLYARDAQQRSYQGIRLGITFPALQRLRGGGKDLEWL